MKKIFTFIMAICFAVPMFSKAIWTESFDYSIGNLTTKTTQDNLSSTDYNSWYYTVSDTKTLLQVAYANLTYPNYCTKPIGKAVKIAAQGYKTGRQFAKITTGSVYVSALIKINTLQGNDDTKEFFLYMTPDIAGSKAFAKLYTKKASDGYYLGIAKYAEGVNYLMYSNKLNYGDTYLIVMQYDFASGEKNDFVSLYINPTAKTTTPTVTCRRVVEENSNNGSDMKDDAASIAGVVINQATNTSRDMIIDEIKVATAWADLFTSSEEEEEEEEDKDPELTVSKSALEFKDFTAGETPSLTFTVTGANLTEDITISSESSAFSFSPTSISKENAGTPTTVTVTLSATQATDFSNQAITIASSELSKTVTVKGNVYIPDYVDIMAFSFLLSQDDTEGKIYKYTGTAAKILSVDEEYKQIVLKDAAKSVKVQISDADWAANTYAVGMKVTTFIFTAEILGGVQPQALCTPITLTFKDADFSREMTSTNLATICLKGDVSNFAQLQEQATFYKILCKQEYEGEVYNIILEEVNANMEAGKPYIFQPKEPCTLKFYYSATTDYAGSENGLIGTFENMNIAAGMYLVSNNMFCKAGTGCTLAANRAYINMSQVPAEENAQPQVGMRQLRLQNADKKMPTELVTPVAGIQTQKFFVKGKLMFKKNNTFYNAQGQIIK